MDKLLIYIPTYNRLNSLVAQINALLPQIRGRSDVRLHIADNASEGINFAALTALIAADNVTTSRNGFNIGGNANIVLGLAHSQPNEALWILSDNDIAHPNAVERILAEMRSGFDLLCMRSHGTERYESTYYWQDGWTDMIGTDVGLISSIVYNAGKFGPHVINGFYYHNSSFPHLAVILAYARANQQIRFTNTERLFNPQSFAGDHIGDYSLSKVGMPLLSEFMPKDKAIAFCTQWLNEWKEDFYRQRASNPSVFWHTLHYLESLSPELAQTLSDHPAKD